MHVFLNQYVTFYVRYTSCLVTSSSDSVSQTVVETLNEVIVSFSQVTEFHHGNS